MPPGQNASLLLEEPLIRTPYELLRRSHRAAQRQVEKEFTAVQTALQSLLKNLPPAGDVLPESTQKTTEGKLDQVSERMRGLKRKLDDLQPSEAVPTPLRARVTYLDQLKLPAKPTVPTNGNGNGTGNGNGNGDTEQEISLPALPLEQTSDRTLDRYVVDYLLRSGRMTSAKALADSSDIENLVDIKLFAELIKIERALIDKKSVGEALAWCGENRGTLKKTKNDLEFILRLQEFIELCRERQTVDAIIYARKNFAPWASTHISEIQQAMTLLVFGERTGVAVYKRLYDRARWKQVQTQFRETFLNLYALPSQPLLSLALSAGLSSLRLPSCVQHTHPSGMTAQLRPAQPIPVPLLAAAPPLHSLENPLHPEYPSTPTPALPIQPSTAVGNVDCPTCHPDLKVLAAEVPMSHHVNSTIVCRISGEVMDSTNEPLAFPNGYVYSSKALLEMAKDNFDVVTCPRTKESCAFSRLRKVYIS